MTKPFDMALFVNGVLAGSPATQRRHLRQALVMQAAIQQRWHRDNPWTWQLKHVRWFLTHYLKNHSAASRYYYQLTASLIWNRMARLSHSKNFKRSTHSSVKPTTPDKTQKQ